MSRKVNSKKQKTVHFVSSEEEDQDVQMEKDVTEPLPNTQAFLDEEVQVVQEAEKESRLSKTLEEILQLPISLLIMKLIPLRTVGLVPLIRTLLEMTAWMTKEMNPQKLKWIVFYNAVKTTAKKHYQPEHLRELGWPPLAAKILENCSSMIFTCLEINDEIEEKFTMSWLLEGSDQTSSTVSQNTEDIYMPSTSASTQDHNASASSPRSYDGDSEEELIEKEFLSTSLAATGRKVSQCIYRRKGDRLYKCETPGERGSVLIKLEYYNLQSMRKVEKDCWWMHADWRASLVLPNSLDRRATFVQETCRKAFEQLVQIPGANKSSQKAKR